LPYEKHNEGICSISPKIQPDWLRSTRATLPQTWLHLAERKTNLEDAFSAIADIRDKNVSLQDDVMTTSSTIKATARSLKAADDGKVNALVLYREMWDSPISSSREKEEARPI
tara:strand:+ start:51 stop:389 length:339 start_codon:yes stop_codon:yes gene_type:complete